MVKIYNSLTRKKEEFKPQKPPQVNIYTCGVTVYDECHIGHARSLYIFDVIRRYLKYRKFKVNFVRNITDIDDKIINRANELKVDWRQLVTKYIDAYYDNLKDLGIEKADSEPRATGNISDMVRYIKGLIDKGYAYITGSGVYFSVRKFKGYGKLSGQSIDQMQAGARIEKDEKKQDPLDFALWKKSKENEPSWDSPWSKGRPGWHIECSVMSQKFLKTDTLDIHAGGRDLIFPHHENEIAQSEAFAGKQFAKYWIHHGLLTINGQKMAKSLGNFITIKDVLKKYPADVLKIFYLQAHYSSPVDFSWEKMEECKSAVERFYVLFDKIERLKTKDQPAKTKKDSSFKKKIDKLKEKFIEAMDDNFNTPVALSVLFDIVSMANKVTSPAILLYAKDTILKLSSIFGLSYKKMEVEPEFKAYIAEKIKERDEARKAKDFEKSDSIREELFKLGIILEDTKEGTTWRKV